MRRLTYENARGESLSFYLSPLLIESLNGIAEVGANIYSQSAPYQDGDSYLGMALEPRFIDLEGCITETDFVRIRKYRSLIMKICNPKLGLGRIVLELDGVTREIYGVPDGVPTFPERFRSPFQKFMITWKCPNPYWQDIKETETNLVSWIPNLEFIEGEGFYTEQSPNYWLETQINKGTIELYNNGTVYVEPVLKDKGIYGQNGIEVPLPIETLEEVKVNGWGIDLDTCVIAEDRLSFTSTAAQAGDVVEYVYWYPRELTACPTVKLGNNTIEGGIGSVDIAGMTGIRVLGNTEIDGEDIKSVIGAMRLKSVGKNLLDENKIMRYMAVNINTGEFVVVDNRAITDFIRIKPNTKYSYIGNAFRKGTGIGFYDKNRVFISGELASSLINPYQTFTTPTNAYYVVLTLRINDIDNYQLEEGIVATPYEPYKEDISYILAKQDDKIVNLKSLPNGVRDEVRMSEGKAIIRTKKKTLEVNDITNVNTLPTNTELIIVKIDDMMPPTDTSKGIAVFEDFAETVSSNYNNPDYIGYWYPSTSGNTIRFIFPKGTTLEQAREQLAGTRLIYQLAEPIIKPLQPQPISPFEEFQSQFGTGEGIEFGYREINQIVEIENIGDVDSPIKVVFRAAGDVVNPLVQNMETKEMIRINKTLKINDKLEITTEFGNKNIYLNGEKAHHYLDFLNSSWLQLSPGINLLKYDAEHGINNLECSIYYTPQYLGV